MTDEEFSNRCPLHVACSFNRRILRGPEGIPLELGPNKFQERLSGASVIQENFLAAGAPPRTPLRELAALSRPRSWWGASFPSPRTPPSLSAL